MNKIPRVILFLILLCPSLVTAQLVVMMTPPKIGGQKAIVHLRLQNNFPTSIESARAICFLLDEQGKMIGQSTKWVIGQNKAVLEPGATNSFYFVITTTAPLAATNLTAKIAFTKVELKGGKFVNPSKEVNILSVAK